MSDTDSSPGQEDTRVKFIEGMIKTAESGNVAFASRVLLWFREDMKYSNEVDPRVLVYLDRCFAKILEGTEPDKALNLRSNNRQSDVWRDMQIVSEIRAMRANGESRVAAQATVADKYHLNLETVKGIVDRFRDFNFKNEGPIFHESFPQNATSEKELLAILSRELDDDSEVKK